MLVTEAQTQVVTDFVSDLVHSKSIEVELQYYEDSKYYDLLQRAQQEAPYRPMSIIQDLLQVAQGLVTVAATLALLFKLSWVVGLIVLVAALPSAIVRLTFSGRSTGGSAAPRRPTASRRTCTGCSPTARTPRRSGCSTSAPTSGTGSVYCARPSVMSAWASPQNAPSPTSSAPLKINVLEVMNPGPANHNAICSHLPLALQTDQNAQPNLSIINRGL